MDNQPNTCLPLCTSSLHVIIKWLFIGLGGASVLVALAIVVQNTVLTQQRTAYEQQATGLERNVAELKSQLAAAQPASDPLTAKSRLLLTEELANTYAAAGLGPWNETATDKTINYINHEKGISVALPYDPDWGNSQYAISPYEDRLNQVSFGTLTSNCLEADCVWTREAQLYFVPPKSADETIQQAQLEKTNGNVGDLKIKKLNLGGHQVVRIEIFQISGLDTDYWALYEVIGKKSNYVIQSKFGNLDPALEKIIGNMQFID